MPDSDQPPNEEEIFQIAAALPATERDAYLRTACDGHPEVRAGVERLLVSIEDEAFMQRSVDRTATPEMEAEFARLKPEEAGEVIGNYKLLQQIGEGGFGTVWMAEQEKPVRRRVALKIIKLGMDTKEVIARFEQERQALAIMDHSNIARVFDAGATPWGRPYFVMELVRGVKITEYCDQASLSTADRLQLFIAVCHAVQHAHQKGIIHRDLKPSNILVTLHDGVPVPKVIDFGVAKATQQQRLTDLTLFTQFEQMIGTPLYMSPEQAELSGLDIDTRSDIYSLGVLLYELLTGRTPFDPAALMRAGLDEIRRVIREEEPQKPSTFVSTMAVDLRTNVAQHRQADGAKLIGLIRGDLDWIVMKALEKDRNRRYETANGMARDIERHLASEPVLARPPSQLYRFRRFAKRNKVVFAAATAVLTALLVGLGVSTWMFYKERHARQAQSQERKKAETEAGKSRQVAQFLKDMLLGVAPSVALGRDTTMLREVLDRTAARVGKDLKDQPQVEAELRSLMGEVYLSLGDIGKADAMQREALAIRQKHLGFEHPDVAASLVSAAGVLLDQEKAEEAEGKLREALAMQKKLLGNESPEIGNTMNGLAYALRRQGKLIEAEEMAREALGLNRRLLGQTHPAVLESLVILCQAIGHQGRGAETESIHREVLAIRRQQYGDEHPDVANSLLGLAQALRDQSKWAESETANRAALAVQSKVYGDNHPIVADSLFNLGTVLQKQEKFAEAEPVYREVLAAYGIANHRSIRAVNGLAHCLGVGGKLAELEALWREVIASSKNEPNDRKAFGQLLFNLADTLRERGKAAEAEPVFREALDSQRNVYGIEHLIPANTLYNLGRVVERQGRVAEAEGIYRDALEILRRVSPSPVILPNALSRLARVLDKQERFAEAENASREVLEIVRNTVGNEGAAVADALYNLARLLEKQEKLAEAEVLDREALTIVRKLQGNEHPSVAQRVHNLAHLLQKKGDASEAEKMYRESLDVRRRLLPPEHADLNTARLCLALFLLKTEQFAQAEPLAREILSFREKTISDDWLTFSARSLLGRCLLGQKKYAEAEQLLLTGYEGMKQREEKIPKLGRPNFRETLQGLVQLYEATGKGREGAAWKRKLVEFNHAEPQKPQAELAHPAARE